ncbi:MAG: type II secretion system F family protein [Candidatus Micrarchaeota archaeon]
MADADRKEQPNAAPAVSGAPQQKPPAAGPALSKPAAKMREAPQMRVGWRKAAINVISAQFPDLKKKLRQADMPDDVGRFITKSLLSAFFMSVVVSFALPIVLGVLGLPIETLVLIFPVLFVLVFLYAIRLPEVRTNQRMRELDKDLVFAGKQMLIELRGGVPLFDAMLGITRDYGEVSKEFSKIVDRINLGDSVDVAMQGVAELNPSPAFRRVLMQLINSIRSGADVAASLDVVLDQIAQEQVIAMKAYGQKLNPLAMFYMMVGVLLPSLGITLVVILSSFMSIILTWEILLVVAIVVVAIQYFFLSLIRTSRPRIDIG